MLISVIIILLNNTFSASQVTVSRLMLHEAIDSVDVSRNEIVLTSGLRLSSQTTLGQLWIEMTANN